MQTYDVIVLGMGVAGSAAAYHLAKSGQRVLALEQFHIDHQLGSSYGVSRIIRYAYDHPAYVALAKAAFPLWRALEEEAGVQLLQQTGGLDFGKADNESLLETRDNLAAGGIAHEWLTPAEVANRFPQFRLDDDMMGVYQADAGYLAASKCVTTQVNLAQKHGAVLVTEARVTGIEPHTDSITVQTTSGRFNAARLVITAGSWAGQLLQMLDLDVPLQPTRERLMFFETAAPDQFTPDRFPVYIAHGDEDWFYGIGSIDGSGLKSAVHSGKHPTDPDNTNREVEPEYIAEVRAFLQRHIPQGDGPVKETRVCLYTMTPDKHFILDRHPAHPHITIGAGFSGHGFKFGNLTGQILADLALEGTTAHDISLFTLGRLFQTT